jgi:hypothetical protein
MIKKINFELKFTNYGFESILVCDIINTIGCSIDLTTKNIVYINN